MNNNPASPWLREGLPPLPVHMKHLPVDSRGFVVPWFTLWDRAKSAWNFQAIASSRVAQAVNEKRCWICGGRLFRNKAFVLGPMCCLTRTSSEPPSHNECASFAVRACPFLIRPRMRRAPMDERMQDAPGIMLERNPGVSVLWITRRFEPFRPPGGGILFTVGDPVRVEAFAEGRQATPEEIEASLAGGLPHLQQLAEQDERDAPGAIAELNARIYRARELLDLPEVPA